MKAAVAIVALAAVAEARGTMAQPGLRVVHGKILLVPATSSKKPAASSIGDPESGYHVELRLRCGGRICANVYMHPPWPKGRIGTTVITTEVPAECAIDNVGEAFFTLVCKTAPPEGARVDFIAVGPEA